MEWQNNFSSSKNQKVLITGASGFLAHYLLSFIPADLQACGWFLSNPLLSHSSSASFTKVDLSEGLELMKSLESFAPDIILHTAAISSPESCEKSPLESWKVNVQATKNIARWVGENGKYMIFCSSEQVFSGEDPPYSESDPVNPKNQYGIQKAESETHIPESSAVVRLPLLWGTDAPNGNNFLKNWKRSLEKGKPVKAYADEYRSAVWASDVASFLWEMANTKKKGTWHLGGVETCSRYHFASTLSERYKRTDLVQQGKRNDYPGKAFRPKNLSMDSTKAWSAGYRPSSFDAYLERDLEGE